jgi:hypothetical protein
MPPVERVKHGHAVGAGDHRLAVQRERLRAQQGSMKPSAGTGAVVQSLPHPAGFEAPSVRVASFDAEGQGQPQAAHRLRGSLPVISALPAPKVRRGRHG